MATTQSRPPKQSLPRPPRLPSDGGHGDLASPAIRQAPVASPDRALRIFVSHNTEYKALAMELRMALQALEFKWPLEILLCEEMQGSTEWEKWIEQSIRAADIFVLLYPHSSMDMSWCNYEKGLFDSSGTADRPVICIKNTDIARPPKVFEKYQPYAADAAGIKQFLFDLFVKGAFTGRRPVNADVGVDGTRFYDRAKEVVAELESHFARARIHEKYFEKRITITLPEPAGASAPLDGATVEGNEVALNLLRLGHTSGVAWPTLRAAVRETTGATWTDDLERALPKMNAGLVPSPLAPFRDKDGTIYIPVIARTASVDMQLRKIVVIFVEADADRLGPMFEDWTPPQSIPDGWAPLIRLIKLMIAARWSHLEPALQLAESRTAGDDDRLRAAASVVQAMDRMAVEWNAKGFGGIERFQSTFDRSMRGDVKRLTDQWTTVFERVMALKASQGSAVPQELRQLLDTNAGWLRLASRQFDSLVGLLESADATPSSVNVCPPGEPAHAGR